MLLNRGKSLYLVETFGQEVRGRTTTSLGIVRAERDGYWDKNSIFRFGEDAYG